VTDEAQDPCYIAALRILNYRFNSEGELRRKLRSKKFEKEQIDTAIARLHQEKWLDDERFAGAFVRTRANKRVGKRRILRELHAAGVDQASAEQAVAANVDPEREQEALLSARLPDFRSDSVTGSGQYIHEEQPDAVVEAVGRLDEASR
jgi:SOS response regulatory protein OraA/RecX